VAIGDINNDTLPDIFFTSNQGSNQLYLNKGDLVFEDISTQAFPEYKDDWTTGVTMADVNNDGWIDIYTSAVSRYKGYRGHNRLWINQGDLTFREAANDVGLNLGVYGTQAAFFDYDKDGDLDVYLLCHSFKDSEVFRDTAMRRIVDPLAGDRLLQNQLMESGELRFEDVTQQAGIYSSAIGFGLGISISDVNDDGWPDIYVGNDFHENDYLYINDGEGGFHEESHLRLPHGSTFSMGNDIADINNDGLLDIMTLDMKPEDYVIYKESSGIDEYNVYQYKLKFGYQNQYSQNCLMINQGNGLYADAANMAGVAATDWSWSVLMEDYDHDGWKDIFVSNGIEQRPNDLDYLNFIASEVAQDKATDETIAAAMPGGKSENYFFKNTKDGKFSNVTEEWLGKEKDLSNGAAVGDLDLDGDLDIVINRINDHATILENIQKSSNYLIVDVLPEFRNKFHGSKVELFANGDRYTDEIKNTRGFQSSSESIAHFGIPLNTILDSLLIHWSDQSFTIVRGPTVNQRLFVTPSGNDISSASIDCNTIQIESLDLVDNAEPDQEMSSNRLTPWSRSTMGPLMEKSKSDGLKLYPHSVYAIMSQRNPGVDFSKMHRFQFTETGAGYLSGVKVNDIDLGMVNDAVWEDMNNDGRPDLVIAAEWKPLQIVFNLPGGFQLSSLPNSTGLWRSIAVSDIDGDGVKDIIAGNMGTNLPLQASKDKPLRLFVGDINDNGAPLPIVTQYIDDRLRVFESKNTIGAAIPAIKKRYTDYQSFAEADAYDIFGEALDSMEQYQAQILESMIFYGKPEGGYQFVSMPMEAQITCVNDILIDDINRDGQMDMVLAGNLYELSPALGRLDGGAIQILYNKGDRGFSSDQCKSNNYIQGQARHILKIDDGEILVSFNNSNVRNIKY